MVEIIESCNYEIDNVGNLAGGCVFRTQHENCNSYWMVLQVGKLVTGLKLGTGDIRTFNASQFVEVVDAAFETKDYGALVQLKVLKIGEAFKFPNREETFILFTSDGNYYACFNCTTKEVEILRYDDWGFVREALVQILV